MVMATAVPSKSTGRFVVERVGAFIKELGIDHLDIVAKSDQEPSIKKLVEDVGKSRGGSSGRWITEFSREKLCFERRRVTWYTVGSRPDQSTQRRARRQVEERSICSRMYCAVDSGVVSPCAKQVRGWKRRAHSIRALQRRTCQTPRN